MKYLILASLLSLNLACQTNKKSLTINNDQTLKSINDSLLNTKNQIVENKVDKNIAATTKSSQESTDYEDSIEASIMEAYKDKNIKPIDDKLVAIESDQKIPNQYKTYWKSYLLYYKSIFYKSFEKNDDKASSAIDSAIETLSKSPKSSEDFALLAACTSFSIQFANMTQMGRISAKVAEYANISLVLNPKNIRAFYVLASNNFYTPKMFGGMTKVEEYALKGLACPNKSDKDIYSPYWGKPKLYDILIQYFEQENRKDDALKYKAIAKKEFPNQF